VSDTERRGAGEVSLPRLSLCKVASLSPADTRKRLRISDQRHCLACTDPFHVSCWLWFPPIFSRLLVPGLVCSSRVTLTGWCEKLP
jgi:hypothetical protein